MAYKYVPWVTGVDGLKPNTKCVLYVLTECAFIARDDKTGKELGYGLVTLKRVTLAQKCGWSKDSVKSLDRELKTLEARKLITIHRNKNPETNHRTAHEIRVYWKPWGGRGEDDGVQESEDESTPEAVVTSTPHGQTTTGGDNRPPGSNDHRGYGQTTTGGYGQTTTKEQGSSNKVLSRVSGEALTAASFLSEEMRAWAEENHPHVNVDHATEKYLAYYADKTTSRKSWEAWIAREKAPRFSTAEAVAEAGKIDRRMKDLRDAGDDDGATALFHAELAPIIEKHDLIRDEWGIGFRKKPKPFNLTEWSMS